MSSTITAKKVVKTVEFYLQDRMGQLDRRSRLPQNAVDPARHQELIQTIETATVAVLSDDLEEDHQVVGRLIDNREGRAYSTEMSEAMEKAVKELGLTEAEIICNSPVEWLIVW
jgi:hypothetical protein